MLKGDTAATLSIKPFAKTDAANYTVRVYNMVDTSNSNTINVKFWAKPKASFRYDSSCVNKPIYFSNLSAVAGSGNVRYAWHLQQLPADSSKDIQHAFQQPGTYQVKLVASPDICPSIADSIVRQVKINGPASNLQYEILKLIRNKPTTLKARDLGISYQWEPTLGLNSMSSRTPTLTPTQEQVYTVQIRDTSGCITVDTQKVLIFAEKEIYVPKGFTPNNDGQNDRLYPILVDIVKLNYFKVYNRWGKLMFHTESAEPGKGWDGVYNGVKQPSDSYTWVSEGLDAEGKTVVKSGTVVLIR
jgi:gliding motility-associated-like protein